MYEPWEVTGEPNLRCAKPYTWPGVVHYAGRKEYWDAQRINRYLHGVVLWAKTHVLPPNRMVAGEEDSWNGMNYEMGKKKIPWQYWQAQENNLPDPVHYAASKEFEPIRRRL